MPAICFPSLLVAAALFASTSCPSAQTSNEAAQDAFRKAVEATCTAAAAAALDDVRATVDPFGSESYGLAILSGVEKGGRATRSVICAYDRQSKRAEVGTPLDLGAAADALADFPADGEGAPGGTAATLIYPGTARCGQDCLAHWTALSADDQNQLTALPEQVRRTLAEAKPGDEPAPIEAARKAAQSMIAAAGGEPDGDTAPDLATIQPGNRSCTLLWFGHGGEASRVHSQFSCRIDRLANGGLNLTRTSGGDNLVFQIQLLGRGLAVVGGRNAPAGPPPGGYDLSRPIDPVNPNYGNQVGLGVARPDGRLFLVSIDERGMAEKDPNFFQMLAVDPPKAK